MIFCPFLMPRSQIKRAPDDFFQLHRVPYDFKTFCSSSHKSNGHRTAVSFGNAVRACSFQFRKTSGGDRTAPARTAVGLRPATVQSPSGQPTIYLIICVQPFVKKQAFQLNP